MMMVVWCTGHADLFCALHQSLPCVKPWVGSVARDCGSVYPSDIDLSSFRILVAVLLLHHSLLQRLALSFQHRFTARGFMYPMPSPWICNWEMDWLQLAIASARIATNSDRLWACSCDYG